MGFYGNVVNPAKTQFTFDRTYPNRKTMEASLATDEIYLGRYVLIEYDLTNKNSLDTYSRVWRVASKDQFFISSTTIDKNRVRWTETPDPNNPNKGADNAVLTGQLVYVENDKGSQTFYKCIGASGSDGQGGYYAAFSTIVFSENNYTQNYNIDMSVYGEGRGYDSTVWQKVYTQGSEKYVMIAELNSVVPTFDIAADAPTMEPIPPHFDISSTNVYYKVHWQPQWGMRIAQADSENKSDMYTAWVREVYNSERNTMSKEYYDYNTKTWKAYNASLANCIPAAIYFNSAALTPQVDENRTSAVGIKKEVSGNNEISILPTGVSGRTYATHNGTSTQVTTAPDIQEFRINLPVVGNVISQAYDIIHGDFRNNSPVDSLQGRLNFFNEMESNEIPVQSSGGYLVGTTVTGDEWINPEINIEDNDNYHQNGFTVTHTYNPVDDETLTSDMNEDNSDTVEFYTPIIDDTGHVVGHKTETKTLPYGFKTIQTNGVSELETDLTTNTTSIVAENTQDSLIINSGNKWIHIANDSELDTMTLAHEVHTITETAKTDSDLDGVGSFTVQDLIFDKAGHVIANQEHKYILPHAIRNIDVAGSDATSEGATAAGKVEADTYNDTLTLNAQNRWVNLKVEDNTISIGHAAAGGTTIKTGGATESTNSETKTLKFGEKFTTPYVNYDEMGHITETGTREVTVPIGSLKENNSTNAANVLTGISFEAKDGAITITQQNASALLLTGHTDTTTGHVSATDNISGAFSKLDQRIDDTNTRIDNLDVTDTATGGDVVSTVQQTDGKITVAHTNVGALNLTGYTLPTAVSNLNLSADESLNTALGKLEFRINEEKNRIDDLDYSDESTTQVISKITQNDGKIAVTRANAGTLLLTGYVKAENEAEVQATDSINIAFGKITKNLDVKTAALSKELTDTIAGLDVDKIEAGEGKVLESVSEADGKISATSKSLGGIKITDYTANSDTANIANTDTLNAALGKLQAQINANESAIEELTKGETVDGINSVKELIEWTETHGTTTTGIINAIGKVAEGDNASTGLYALIDAETAARTQADIDTNKRIDDLVKVTEAEKTQWNAAEANVQSDWNETDNTKDSFILNKPTNLVTEETTFVYSEAQVDDEGNEIPETEIRVTIQELLTMVKDLTVALQNANDRITELEKYHSTNENGGTEVPPVDNGGEEETPTDPETPST